MAAEVKDMHCDPCWVKGHNCPGHDLVDGKVVCVWCLDGVDCPKMKAKPAERKAKVMPRKNPEYFAKRNPQKPAMHVVHSRHVAPGRAAKERMKGNAALEQFVTLQCSVAALDRFLTGLPIADKQNLANAYLKGEI